MLGGGQFIFAARRNMPFATVLVHEPDVLLRNQWLHRQLNELPSQRVYDETQLARCELAKFVGELMGMDERLVALQAGHEVDELTELFVDPGDVTLWPMLSAMRTGLLDERGDDAAASDRHEIRYLVLAEQLRRFGHAKLGLSFRVNRCVRRCVFAVSECTSCHQILECNCQGSSS